MARYYISIGGIETALYEFDELHRDDQKSAIVDMWEQEMFDLEKFPEPEDIPLSEVLDTIENLDLLFTIHGYAYVKENDCVRTVWKLYNVPEAGPHDLIHDNPNSARRWMEEHGYVYVTSTQDPWKHRYFDTEYYVAAEHITSADDMDNLEPVLDRAYGMGYEPVICPEAIED